ncbi:MAG: aldose 1-epimerase, partial [Planctomycetaceae bacterium]|nr:aldose 1-epimerase [Planctomycetaceae bacterium]
MLLTAGQDYIEVDPLRGGRVASFRISGLSIIVEEGPSDLEWGCYPMVPWAGRVRHGKFRWLDRTVELPLRMPPHAIHGTVLDRAWNMLDDHHLESDLGDDWPWQGRVQSSFEMGEGRFCWRLGLSSDATQMPAMMGWHPWFWKSLEDGSLATLHFDAETIFTRDQEGLPSGKKSRPASGPFDDCFT